MSRPFRIAAVGDVALVGRVAEGIRKNGPDWVLQEVGPVLGEADLTVFNLEMPFAPPDAPHSSHVPAAFRADPAQVAALRFPGLRIAGLANNHIMDFGSAGLDCTRAALDREGIHHGGAGRNSIEARRPVIVETRGLRVGVLAYASRGSHSVGAGPGAAVARVDEIVEDVRRLRAEVDLLLVQLHQGLTYVDMPPPDAMRLARAAAKEGADLVLGHHPHVLHGSEHVGGAFVAHSLGEFVFDGGVGNVKATFAEGRRKQSVVLIAEAVVRRIQSVRFEPVTISEDGRPTVPSEAERARIEQRLESLCQLLRTEDYDKAFRENAGQNLVGHETNVMLRAVARGDLMYLVTKIGRVRPRHLALLAAFLRKRWSRRPAAQAHGDEGLL